jgi:hypothetical protein
MAKSSALFDEEGNLRLEVLSDGMFTLRFAPGNTALVFTWIPDDLTKSVKRTRVEIPQPAEGDEAAGENEYFACLAAEGGGGVEAGLMAILRCMPNLLV